MSAAASLDKNRSRDAITVRDEEQSAEVHSHAEETSWHQVMSTVPKHSMLTPVGDGSDDLRAEECRCMIGIDHYEEDDRQATEYINESDAEDWSSGPDEYDYFH